MGWKAGLLVLAGDFAKGAIASGVGLAVAGRGGGFALGIAAVIGHMFPVTRRFKGGKGVATAGGMLVVLYPVIVLVLARRLVPRRPGAEAGVGRLAARAPSCSRSLVALAGYGPGGDRGHRRARGAS